MMARDLREGDHLVNKLGHLGIFHYDKQGHLRRMEPLRWKNLDDFCDWWARNLNYIVRDLADRTVEATDIEEFRQKIEKIKAQVLLS